MSDNTSIEWSDASWNPIRARDRKSGKVGWHCQIVTPGCGHCYASGINLRLGTKVRYNSKPNPDVELFLDEKILTQPLRWRKPRRVFVCSMTDLFGTWVQYEWIDRIFAVMALAPQHTFQVLTKRSARMRRYVCTLDGTTDRVTEIAVAMADMKGTRVGKRVFYNAGIPGWPLQNVWLGVSAEDQKRLDERVPDLLATPAAGRWVSAEPLLGPLDFNDGPLDPMSTMGPWSMLDQLGWVVVGGESGPGARPMDIAWARDIVRQCGEAGVACFVKQLGRYVLDGQVGTAPGVRVQSCEKLRHPKGGDPAEWPDDLRVREYPHEAKL